MADEGLPNLRSGEIPILRTLISISTRYCEDEDVDFRPQEHRGPQNPVSTSEWVGHIASCLEGKDNVASGLVEEYKKFKADLRRVTWVMKLLVGLARHPKIFAAARSYNFLDGLYVAVEQARDELDVALETLKLLRQDDNA